MRAERRARTGTLSAVELRAMADAAVRLAVVVRAAVDHGVVDRMAERAGPAMGAGGSGPRPRGAYGDPTAAAALRNRDVADPAALDRLALGALVHAAASALRRAERLCERYPVATEPALALGGANSAAPGCTSCARLPGARGRRWEPPDGRLAGPTTVGGRLEAPTWLCVWCVERLRSWGRLPTVDELDRHHAGRRVPWPADIPQPIRRRSE